MRRVVAAAAVAAACGLAIACANVLGIETLTKAPQEAGPVADAYVAPDGAPDPCTSDPGSPPPDASDTPTSIASAWFVVDKIDFGTDDQAPGLNLDHLCTGPDGKGSSCGLPGPSGLYKYTTDEPGGADNAGRHPLDFPFFGGGSLATGLIAQVATRQWTFAFRLEGYNGLSDDPAVILSMISANGDGTGKWSADALSTAPTSAKAWVNGGKLTAFFTTPLPLPVRVPLVGSAMMLLRFAVVTADVTLADAGGAVASLDNGILGARWLLTDAITQLGNLTLAGNPACATIKSFMCKLPDIPSDPTNDGNSSECDALSGGFGFHALPSAMGAPADGGTITAPTPCACP